jgi:hypothetical protein
MIIARSHAWNPLQKRLIMTGVAVGLWCFSAGIYVYERYYRGPSDSVLVGTWEIPGGDLSLCYRFDPDHRVQIGGCGETEAIVRGVSAPQAS